MSKCTDFELHYLVSDFSEFRDVNEVTQLLKEISNEENIHFWSFDKKLPAAVNSYVREVLISELNPDQLLVLDLFESSHHIPNSVNKHNYIETSVVLYDLIPLEDEKEYLYAKHLREHYFEKIEDLQRADKILCISQYTKTDLSKRFPFLSKRASFIGGGPILSHRNENPAKQKRVLSILGDNPRKNLERLLDAWMQLPEHLILEFELRIIGNFSTSRILHYQEYINKNGSGSTRITFCGEISNRELEQELDLAFALIHPAKSEGLGLPILEGIAAGIPVLCSNTTSMTEIGGIGACFSPLDTNEMVNSIEDLLMNPNFLHDVKVSQTIVAEEYSWANSAKLVFKQLAADAVDRPRLELDAKEKSIRVAVVAPGENQKTGIARFASITNSMFPKHWNLTFFPTEKLSDLNLALGALATYEIVIVHIGNSPHHKNAFRILGELPAVVVCHDITFGQTLRYLSNLDPKWMPELCELEGISDDLLFSRSITRILNLALGVVVHSRYAQEVLRRSGMANQNVLLISHPPLFVDLEENRDSKSRRIVKNRVISAGFINQTKCPEKIIEAVSLVNKRSNFDLELTFVGEAEFEYSNKLKRLAKEQRLKIEITGYLPLQNYHQFMSEASIAIQLKSIDSGEASGVIPDLLYFGIPTIINSIGNFENYSGELITKVSKHPTPLEISEQIEAIYEKELNHDIVDRALSSISGTENSPASWSNSVASFAIDRYSNDVIHRARLGKTAESNLILNFERLVKRNQKLRKTGGSPYLIGSDISNLIDTKYLSGIQRVTTEAHTELSKFSQSETVLFGGVNLTNINDFNIDAHDSIKADCFVAGPRLDPNLIDALLLLDLNFNLAKSALMDEFKSRGVPIITNVYDVLPFSNPQWFPPKTADLHFNPWLDKVLASSTHIIVNSEHTKYELTKYPKYGAFRGQTHVVPLGSYVPKIGAHRRLVPGQTLMVGTLEPRKGHQEVLNSFDAVVKKNENTTLHIVGRQGWMVESLVERIMSHPLLNSRLFWHKDCSDEQLEILFSTSDIAIVASEGEGFGLPVVEALNRDLRVIARDIPVLRETGGNSVHYFNSENMSLEMVWSGLLQNKLTLANKKNHPNASFIQYAQHLISILKNELLGFPIKVS